MGIKFGKSLSQFFLTTLMLIALMNNSDAQVDSTIGYDWNGDWVKNLTVEKGKTIYNLTKTNSISESELYRLNPALKDGLKAGMIIRVPAEKKSATQSNNVAAPPQFKGALRHTVKKKETLYGIAKMYGVSTDDIYALNPQLKDGMQPNMVLTIYPKPSIQPKQEESAEVISIQEITKRKEKSCNVLPLSEQKRVIKVSLLLPLYLNSELNVNEKSRIGLDFYGGAKLAMDSLKSLGFNVKVQVFDTQNDTTTVADVLRNSALKESDLIIGPLYSSAFIKVADFARKHKIPAVSPFSQSETLLENFPNVFKVTPNATDLIADLAPALKKVHPKGKFTLVKTESEKDEKLYVTFIESWKKNNLGEIAESPIKDFRTSISSLDPLADNIIIFLSTEQVKIIDLIGKLNAQRKESEIFLVGLNEWNSLDNLDYDQLNNLSFTYASPVNYDFTSAASLKFQSDFRDEFKGEPNFYAYQGFDICYYFTRQVARLESNFLDCIDKQNLECGFNSCYSYKSSLEGSGFDNGHINVLRLTQFKPKRIN
jgi:LysM repeat protein